MPDAAMASWRYCLFLVFIAACFFFSKKKRKKNRLTATRERCRRLERHVSGVAHNINMCMAGGIGYWSFSVHGEVAYVVSWVEGDFALVQTLVLGPCGFLF